MTTATPPVSPPLKTNHKFDPDSYRMTIGEHLEDLRRRMIFGLLGFAVAVAVCVMFSQRTVEFFTKPLVTQMLKHNLNPQMVYTEITEVFMTYLKIWLISAGALAGPWMIYQLWQFVAAGLYPHERKVVTRYIPLSITLLIGGMVFVYMVVLPLSIGFFLEFSGGFKLPGGIPLGQPVTGIHETLKLPVLDGDPVKPADGEVWINRPEGRIKGEIGGGIRTLMTASDNLLTPTLRISTYVDLVLTFMLTFGLAFQLPLVVMALVASGLVELDFLRKQRRMIYFVMAVASAFLAPGEIVTSMLSLLLPLMALYEFGLWMANLRLKARARAEAAELNR